MKNFSCVDQKLIHKWKTNNFYKHLTILEKSFNNYIYMTNNTKIFNINFRIIVDYTIFAYTISVYSYNWIDSSR